MSANETYKQFVLRKLRDVLGETDEQIIDFMIRDWLSTHPVYVANAGATVADWRASQELNGRGTGRGLGG